MADSVRLRRVAEQIRAELSQILREEVNDPRIGLVTITRVKLAVDLGAATVFYSPLAVDLDEAKLTDLRHAMGAVSSFCRRTLAKRIQLRRTPELRFVFDDSVAKGSETLEVIRSLEIQPEADESAEHSTEALPPEDTGAE